MLPSQLRFGPFAMDRRRAVALILGLVLCLALLGRWVVRFDKDEPPAESPTAAEPGTPAGAIGEIVQVVRDDPKKGEVTSYQAPIGPGVFRGRVIDATTREPIREFTVEFHQPQRRAGPQPSPISRSFRTKDGRFEQRDLPVDLANIFTSAPGYQRFDIPGVSLSEQAPVKEILIPIRAGHALRGRVIDEITKEPIAAAKISFREAAVGRYQGNFRARPSVLSGKDGAFVLDGVPPGAVNVEALAPGYTFKEIETFISDKTPPVEVALSKGGMIAGYLAEADGLTPIKGDISLAHLDEDIGAATATGNAGEFSFDRLNAGRYLLSGHAGSLHGQREIELSHNERRDDIVLAMNPGHNVRGVVTGLRPEERAGAYLNLFAEGSRTGLAYNATLDERGAYEVRGVAAGTIRIQVNAGARGVVTKVLQMPADTDLTANMQFEPGARLSGRVTLGGKPLAGAMLRPNSALLDGNNDLFLAPAVTSANGEYSYDEVPKGDYVFMIESYASPRVRVDGDTVFDIDVPEVQLSGHVFEEGSKVPVVGVRVSLRPVPSRSQSNGLTNGSNNFGQFGIRGLQPGDYMLSAYKSGYELYRAPLSYGSPIADMTIYMRPARGVEIKVREAGTNKAIDNVLVVEIARGGPGVAMQLQTDQSGVSYLPSGLVGSSLKVSAFGYHTIDVTDWNGQQLDLNLQREQ
ncbi:MAG TPA: carboxypeptidase regulatory-like domain-containing protein [Steroidobacter sp.]